MTYETRSSDEILRAPEDNDGRLTYELFSVDPKQRFVQVRSK